ncbi:glycosyltransferase family 4 protein [Candidatus Woesearchaeota archaeon]|nr:glycosyltransferase family 4 protein [Nanoarchaeota archaeon]MCB9370061.1 glycosyltransferase family 4 protein [Candidatus Woesearchaeota archaeon]USN44591.1 MAG: glycosyltransferase family 4 protein [Candidatus Woesearchaeota archaeon]
MNTKKNKVKLLVFPGHFLPHIGGLESHVDNFARELSKKEGYEITIFTPQYNDAKEEEIIHTGVKVIRYPSIEIVHNYFIPKFYSWRFYKLFYKVYSSDFHIAMSRTMFFTNSTLAYVVSKWRIKRKKLLHVEHASDYSHLKSKFQMKVNKFYMNTVGKLLVKRADSLAAVSKGAQTFLSTEFKVKKPIQVIYRGFNHEEAKTIVPKRFPTERKNLVFVGRLLKGKGVQDLLQALSFLKEIDVHLYIIGSGDYEIELQKLVKVLHLEGRVSFEGSKSGKECLSYIKAADIFVNPSHNDGLATTLIEAFFCRTQILATDVGGTFEVLEEEWNKNSRYQLIPAKDPKAMAKVLKKMLAKKASPLNEKLYKKIEKKFDWEEHANSYDKLIKKTLKK